jgi:hypothetical protein
MRGFQRRYLKIFSLKAGNPLIRYDSLMYLMNDFQVNNRSIIKILFVDVLVSEQEEFKMRAIERIEYM